LAQHLSDEEQLESLKRWWKENGAQLLIMVVVIIGSWFGWQQWQDYREQTAAAASAIYSDIMELASQRPVETLTEEDKARLQSLAGSLRVDYQGSQYAQYANMMLARMAVGDDELGKAAELLQEVIETSDDAELANVARIRLARVEIAKENYSRALEILAVDVPLAMASLFAELRGDVHYYLEDFGAARAAYQSALTGLIENGDISRPLLEFKLNRVLDGEPSEAGKMKEES
jgi:predicted negative regulator of RcsB-dependent stress response